MEFPDEEYRDVCNVKTLYSTTEGFFSEFVKVVLEEIDEEWIINSFEKQNSEVDKIRICCNDFKVWPAIQRVLKNVSKVYRKKSEEAAKQSQLDGDDLCKMGDFKKAVMIYSQSIIRAPQRQKEESKEGFTTLSLAYKGRANALFNLGHYEECMIDLNMAMKSNFPNSVKYQIYKRMGECYENLSDLDKAGISLRVALKLLDEQLIELEKTSLKQGTKAEKSEDAILVKVLHEEREEIKGMLARLTTSREREGKPEVQEFDIQYKVGPLPEVTDGPNQRYPNASKLIKIRQSPDAGRFGAAAEKIDVGATLVVEEPQAALLIPQMLSSHCCHCFTRLFAPMPCRTCSGVAFCSVQCRDSATAGYHKYECEFLGLFLGSGMSVLSRLSLRMVTQESLSFFKGLLSKIRTSQSPEMESSQSAIEFTERESRYMQVYSLVTHSQLRTGLDYFRKALMAIFLVKCLKKTDYFEPRTEKNDPDRFSQDEILAASVILHHLELLQFNAHEIYETRISQALRTRDSKAVCIGVGIYPTVALFNHECFPSVTRYFNGKNIVIKAVRTLEKDEILSENYGPHYAKKPLPCRTRELTSRYWFQCQCRACIEDWPLLEDMEPEDFKIRCATPNCDGFFPRRELKKNSESNPICWICLRKTNVVEVLKRKSQIEILFQQSLNHMETGNCAKAIPLLCSYLNKIFQLAVPPCSEIFLTQEALRTCFAQTGSVWILDE